MAQRQEPNLRPDLQTAKRLSSHVSKSSRHNAVRDTNIMRQAMSIEAVDHPSAETVKVRQGTGPRATVSVLLISLTAAAVAGVLIVGYFAFVN